MATVSDGNPATKTPRTVVEDLQELGGMAKEMVQEKAGQAWEGASDCARDSAERMRKVEHRVEEFVREQPLSSILIAAGVGMLLGSLWMRR